MYPDTLDASFPAQPHVSLPTARTLKERDSLLEVTPSRHHFPSRTHSTTSVRLILHNLPPPTHLGSQRGSQLFKCGNLVCDVFNAGRQDSTPSSWEEEDCHPKQSSTTTTPYMKGYVPSGLAIVATPLEEDEETGAVGDVRRVLSVSWIYGADGDVLWARRQSFEWVWRCGCGYGNGSKA